MTYLIDNFLKRQAVTAIYGRPASFQQFLAEEVAFSAASGLPLFSDPALIVHRFPNEVVCLVDGRGGETTLLSRLLTWRHARGIASGMGLNITPIDATALSEKGYFVRAFLDELHKRRIDPALIVSLSLATEPQGFFGTPAQDEIAMAKKAAELFGCAVLLASHTGPMGRPGDLADKVDDLWHVSERAGRVTLTQGDTAYELIGKNVGGDGRVVTRIFDTEKIIETV